MAFPTCVVNGTVLNADSSPLFDVAVRARIIDPGGGATFIGTAAVSTLSLVTRTDENGIWSIALPREVEAIITIDEVDYTRQVTIPDQSSVNLSEL